MLPSRGGVMDIGKTIRTLRTAAGLSQKDLAARVGLSASGLSLIESGAREPTVTFLKNVSRELGVPVSVLFVESEEVPAGLTSQQAENYVRVQSLLADIFKNVVLEKFKS